MPFFTEGNVLSWATFFPLIGAAAIVVLLAVKFAREPAEAGGRPGLALDRARHERPVAPRRDRGVGHVRGRPARAAARAAARLDQALQRRVLRRRRRALHLDGAPLGPHLLHRDHRLDAVVVGREGGRDGRHDRRRARRPAPPEALLGADGPRLHGHAAPAADRHDGHLRRARHVPLLRLLGGHAPADVLPHRHLGRAAQGVRGHQVLPLHPRRLGADAARDHRPLLQRRPASTSSDGTATPHTFNLIELGRQGASGQFGKAGPILGFAFVKVVCIALFIGFAIKIPMFPFHTWLPDAHVEAPTPISVILAGVLLKMGTYGILRFNFAILPDATTLGRARHRGVRRHQHRLRRVLRHGADRPEEAGRVLVGLATWASACSAWRR